MIKRLVLSLVCFATVTSYAASYDVLDFYVDYKKIINELYKGIDAIISEEERSLCSATGGSPVYGEILYDSCAVLISEMKLTENDVFYDLGSGLGKFITQVYVTSPVKKAWGIEFSENRFERAQKATKNLEKIQGAAFECENKMRKAFDKNPLEKTKGKKFGFTNQDMLKADLSDATVVFTCSTCFSPEFMQKLTNKLADVGDGLRILTLVQLPYHKHVHFVTMYILPMTWSQETPVYSYVVDSSRIAEKPADQKESTEQKEEPVAAASQDSEEETPEDGTLNLDADEDAAQIV